MLFLWTHVEQSHSTKGANCGMWHLNSPSGWQWWLKALTVLYSTQFHQQRVIMRLCYNKSIPLISTIYLFKYEWMQGTAMPYWLWGNSCGMYVEFYGVLIHGVCVYMWLCLRMCAPAAEERGCRGEVSGMLQRERQPAESPCTSSLWKGSRRP